LAGKAFLAERGDRSAWGVLGAVGVIVIGREEVVALTQPTVPEVITAVSVKGGDGIVGGTGFNSDWWRKWAFRPTAQSVIGEGAGWVGRAGVADPLKKVGLNILADQGRLRGSPEEGCGDGRIADDLLPITTQKPLDFI